MKALKLFLPVAGLLLGTVLGAQVKTEVKDFRLAGPFATMEGARIADVRIADVQPSTPWSGDVLPSLESSPSAGILTFRVGSGSYLKGRLNIEGPKDYKLWIDGKESDGNLRLNPYPHEFKLLYLTGKGA